MRKFLILLISINLNSQNVVGVGKEIKYPSAPSLYAFTKYGDIGFNEYRGLADVSLPLHNIKIDEIEIPIDLKYYTGGIKVSEEAGLVGLGWSFNLPAIIQDIKDEDDFIAGTRFQKLPDYTGTNYMVQRGNLHPSVSQNSYEGMNYAGGDSSIYNEPSYFVSSGPFLVVNNKYVTNIANYISFLSDIDIDSEADIFRITLNNTPIVFIRRFESINTTTAQNIGNITPSNPFKVINGREEYKVSTIDGSNYSNNGIKIIDPMGNTYFFSAISEIKNAISNGGFFQQSISSGANYKTTSKVFNITKIITNVGNEIIFEYNTPIDVTNFQRISTSFHKKMGQTSYNQCTSCSNRNDDFAYDSYYQGQSGFVLNNPINTFYQEQPIGHTGISSTYFINLEKINSLKKIKTKNETLDFTYSERIDVTGMKKLDQISLSNNLFEKIKDFNFTYEYFDSVITPGYEANYNQDILTKRLKLKSLAINNEYFEFEYNSLLLPNKNSYSTDFWGYYNGSSNSSFSINFNEFGMYNSYGIPLNDNLNNTFLPNLSFAKACSLNKIIYPTKGYTEIEYDFHEFDNYLNQSETYINPIQSGYGLRVKKITKYSKTDQVAGTISYKYNGGKCIFKKKLISFENVSVLQKLYEPPGINNPCGITVTFHSNSVLSASLNNSLSNSSTNMEDYIGYNSVEITDSHKGKIIKKYYNNPFTTFNVQSSKTFSPMCFKKRDEMDNGLLLEESIFAENNSLLRKINYGYKRISSTEKRYGVRVSYFDILLFSTGFSSTCTSNNLLMPNYLLTSYPIFSNSWLINKITKQDFYNNNSILSKEDIYHNSNNSITSKNFISNGLILAESYSYFNDNNFLNNNFLKITKDKTINENNTFKSKTEFQYTLNSNNSLILNKQITSFDNITNTLNKKTLFYDLYDDKNNIIQFHNENGIYTTIIWGYNKTLPVMKIENCKYSEIESFVENIQNYTNQNNETQLNILFNVIRGSVLPNALVTSYLHKPLIGLSTLTDPKGDTQTYHYDSFNRLQFVKDKEGKILSENEYHFKN